jgi:hypothetical protein
VSLAEKEHGVTATAQHGEYVGKCFCGTVQIRASGAPLAMGYCHCKDCRAWSAGPVNAFTLWQPEGITVERGEEFLASFALTGASHRKFCMRCGGHVMSSHPDAGLVDVFAAILPDLQFVPTLHVNYASAVLPVRDGLPKLKDFPADMGGSGELLAE